MDGKGIIGWALEIEVETHEVRVDGSSIDFDIDIGSGGNIDIELAAVKNLKASLEVFIGCELESTTNLFAYAKIVWVKSELADLRKEFGHLIDEKLGKNDLKTINGKSLIITDPNDTDIVIDQLEPDLLNCNMTYELVDGQIVWSCDHTWDEIYTAIQDGKIVKLLVDGTTFMPFIVQNTAGAFSNSTHIELENDSTYEWNVSFTYDNGIWELHNELTPVFTSSDKTKLDSIEEGAQVNVQSDWNQIDNTANDFIKNKPSIPTIGLENFNNTDWDYVFTI